jgi:NTP pyrophosphatase (non-canonical NTP hydrolase)
MPQQNCFLPTNCESGAEGNYVSFVLNRFTKLNAGVLGLVHAAVGISGEAGELLDAVKKHWVYGKPLDVQNVIEELGDLEFYAAALRALIGVSREEVIKANVDKLRKRYPDGYTDALAAARLDKVTETQILES